MKMNVYEDLIKKRAGFMCSSGYCFKFCLIGIMPYRLFVNNIITLCLSICFYYLYCMEKCYKRFAQLLQPLVDRKGKYRT